jgi:hypothetical protein
MAYDVRTRSPGSQRTVADPACRCRRRRDPREDEYGGSEPRTGSVIDSGGCQALAMGSHETWEPGGYVLHRPS